MKNSTHTSLKYIFKSWKCTYRNVHVQNKSRLKPTFATVFYNVFQTDLKSRMIGIIFGILVLCCPPHIHPKEIMILDYSCSTYFFCKRQMKRSSTYLFCKRQIKRKDLMIDSVGLVFGRGLVVNILRKKIDRWNRYISYLYK